MSEPTTAAPQSWRESASAALAPWVVSRFVVLGAIAVAVEVSRTVGARPLGFVNDGLFAWDAAYYRDIAEGGYHAVELAGLRFFPLLPMLGWLVGVGVRANWGVVIVANLAAFAAMALVHRVVLDETRNGSVARRAVWFFALFPAAAVLVLPYSEGLLVCAAALFLLGVRRRIWWLAMVAGVAAGLARPTGLLLVVPALVAWWRVRHDRRAWLPAAGAAFAPIAGVGAFLTYSAVAFGDFWRPLQLQSAKNLRGGVVDPFTRLARGVGDLFGDRVGSGLHVLWAGVVVALLVVMIRRLPAEYSWWAGVSVVVALSADNLDSFERYCLVVFPFAWVLATLARREWSERAVLGVWGAGLVAYTVLGVFQISIP
ncbi:MAG: hypothetical protein ACOYNI_02680 [Acidimicrobiia bacterium]